MKPGRIKYSNHTTLGVMWIISVSTNTRKSGFIKCTFRLIALMVG